MRQAGQNIAECVQRSPGTLERPSEFLTAVDKTAGSLPRLSPGKVPYQPLALASGQAFSWTLRTGSDSTYLQREGSAQEPKRIGKCRKAELPERRVGSRRAPGSERKLLNSSWARPTGVSQGCTCHPFEM